MGLVEGYQRIPFHTLLKIGRETFHRENGSPGCRRDAISNRRLENAVILPHGLVGSRIRELQQRLRWQLLEWYAENQRDLPWRRSRDPYAIWVSEIMLQQTRVAVVVERYQAFLERFPTLVSLALAPEQDVLALWSGLGYYRRARMLHKAAQFVAEHHDGNLPQTAEELRMLPGIGAYTAAAIASIAHGEHVAVVDGNVERVLCRLQGWEAGRPIRRRRPAPQDRGPCRRASRSRASRRLQPGHDGTGRDGLRAAQSAVPGLPFGR